MAGLSVVGCCTASWTEKKVFGGARTAMDDAHGTRLGGCRAATRLDEMRGLTGLE